MYEFIDAEYATCGTAPTITRMCRWLEVSKSGFYDWKSRPESSTAERRKKLALIIKRIFDDSDSTYGYWRIAEQLARQGIVAGPELAPQADARAGPGGMPAAAVAADDHETGAGRPDPGPGEPRLRRRYTGREDGR
jgi:hypothetical protein